MQLEKQSEQFGVRELIRIEIDAKRFSVPGFSGLDGFICRIFGCAAGVADFRFENSGNLAKKFLDAPKTTASEICSLFFVAMGATVPYFSTVR